jgi:hypothetical protein
MWLRQLQCPFDVYTCTWAAEGGQLEVLKWLRGHECPWNEWTWWGGAS